MRRVCGESDDQTNPISPPIERSMKLISAFSIIASATAFAPAAFVPKTSSRVSLCGVWSLALSQGGDEGERVEKAGISASHTKVRPQINSFLHFELAVERLGVRNE